jgi:hypothetical protein
MEARTFFHGREPPEHFGMTLVLSAMSIKSTELACLTHCA